MNVIVRALPYLLAFAVPCALTLVLTPIVREINRRLGIVDKPDPRRINKIPVPRGGGVALFLGMTIPFLAVCFCDLMPGGQVGSSRDLRLIAISSLLVVIGYADDKWSLKPLVKLAGQVAVALLTWAWAGIGFHDIWPSIPVWFDCAMTVCWFVGAINAFNLIDGLDGLASGLALIAVIGMAGMLVITNQAGRVYPCLMLAGAILGFLRYNYNPASVFLGDSGSMFLGFAVSALPMLHHEPDSVVVSIGMPMLAMGVPIFDTSLAIMRRTIRRLLNRGSDSSGKVMSADTDHLHHRILRWAGLNQRKAAWTLYGMAAVMVAVGLLAISLRSRAAGLWMLVLSIGSFVAFKDFASIEMFDAGRLLSGLAHVRSIQSRRRLARVSMPFHVVSDVVMLAIAFVLVSLMLRAPTTREYLRFALPLHVLSTLACLVFFRTYATIWSRAVTSNYLRMIIACVFGAIIGSVSAYYVPSLRTPLRIAFTMLYALLAFVFLCGVRLVRGIVRDMFYALDCSMMKGRKDVSRILVYGAGLRYHAFRRELVRTSSANNRIIVGIIDDDILLRGRYIGGIRVYGTLGEAHEIINALNVDTVVIACVLDEPWKKVVCDILAPTGVKVTKFVLEERPFAECSAGLQA